jgi:hypothetical protein
VIIFLSLLGGVLVSVELYQIMFYLNMKRAMHDLEKILSLLPLKSNPFVEYTVVYRKSKYIQYVISYI